MTYKTIKGDLLGESFGILVHGVNCRGRMGAGIGLTIAKRYPQVYKSYIAFCDRLRYRHDFLLGQVDFVKITDDLIIANAFTQHDYGRESIRYVSYDAVDSCFSKIGAYAASKNLPVMFPKIGAGLAGGNWDVISAIIESNRCKDVDYFLFSL